MGRLRVVSGAHWTDELPDLPGLESVRAGLSSRGAVICTAYCPLMLWFAVAVNWGVIKFYDFLADDRGIALAGTGIIDLLLGWVVLRLLTAEFFWKADAHGLTARGMLRRRLIVWDQVTQAETGTTITGHPVYRLLTSRGTVVVASGGNDILASRVKLAASVWQHLRRHGKAGDVVLPAEALTLWDTVPDELPRRIDWTERWQRYKWGPAILSVGTFGSAIVCCVWLLVSGGNPWTVTLCATLGVAFVALLWLTLSQALQYAWRFALRDDYFEAEMLWKTIFVQWSDVMRAGWEVEGISIRTSRPRARVLLRWHPADEGSCKLILAVIRRLGTAGRPQSLIIPPDLRSISALRNAAGDSVRTTPVELKFSLGERLLITGMFGLVGLVGAVRPAIDRTWLGVLIAAGVFALAGIVFLVSGTYAVRVDDTGVTKRFAGWGKLVTWDQIDAGATLAARKGRLQVTNPRMHILRDARGKVVADLTFRLGPKLERDAFDRYVATKLFEMLPPGYGGDSWKARPWKAET